MKLDLTNEQHRKALRTVCETLLLPGMPADAAADLAARADVASPAQLAFLALALPEQSAALVRALLAGCGVTLVSLSCGERLDSVTRIEIHPRGWQWAPVPLFEMANIPPLVLRLLDAKDQAGAIAALSSCQDVPAFGPTRPPPPPPPPGAVAEPCSFCKGTGTVTAADAVLKDGRLVNPREEACMICDGMGHVVEPEQ